MAKRMAKMKSMTTKGLFYEIRQGDDGKLYCTCPSWKFSSPIPEKSCKHLRQFVDARRRKAA